MSWTALDVCIVGGGFAGTLLARCLRSRGATVGVLERQRHPRFALGESTTPLGNLALQRLAARYGLDDLRQLSTHGLWQRYHPELPVGRKRGFTFYRHDPGGSAGPFVASAENRLMVAASPSDELSDTQWLRSAVDRFFYARAREEGALCAEGTAAIDVERRGGGWRVRTAQVGAASDREAPPEVRARFLVDATGGSDFAVRCLDAGTSGAGAAPTSLLYAHFENVPELESAPDQDLPFEPEWAAVHHLLGGGDAPRGWMYRLRFDDGRVSLGLVERGRAGRGATEDDPARALRRRLEPYPELLGALERSRALRPVARIDGLAYRRARPAGDGWALLPHAYTFVDPLFSTGIAWSLVAVERLAEALSAEPAEREQLLARYAALLPREADHIATLIDGSWAAMPCFERFTSHAQLYFVCASWCETVQRLLSPEEDGVEGGWHWQGFLGAEDAVLGSVLPQMHSLSLEHSWPRPRALDSVAALIARRNVAGLADPEKANLYPATTLALRRAPEKLGLTATELARRLPRLFSADATCEPQSEQRRTKLARDS